MENEQITVIENTEEENGNEKKQKQKKWLKRMLFVLLILLLLLFSFFLLRREETKVYIREYEEHVERLWETKEDVEEKLASSDKKYSAVYLTSPDYLGHISDIKGISEVSL